MAAADKGSAADNGLAALHDQASTDRLPPIAKALLALETG
jgi:hypothetical protein